MQSDLDKKAGWFLNKVIDSLEDIGNNSDDGTATKTEKVNYVGTVGGIALAAVLEQNGVRAFIRLICGAIRVRVKHPGLIEIRED